MSQVLWFSSLLFLLARHIIILRLLWRVVSDSAFQLSRRKQVLEFGREEEEVEREMESFGKEFVLGEEKEVRGEMG